MTNRLVGGFTLVEILLGSMTLAIAIAALLGAFLSQITLNEHGRNLSLMIHDANRILEELRLNNSPCPANQPPQATPPAGFNTWDAWLADPARRKSLPSPNPNAEELIVITCQDRDGGNLATDYCGNQPTAQVSANEWTSRAAATILDPIRVSVAVCWRHRNRTLGECTWNGAALVPDDTMAMPNDTAGVIDSPAMLTTLVTCRGS